MKASSKVFCAMINGSFKEKNIIRVDEQDYDLFYSFIKFIYTLNVKEISTNIINILRLSDKYLVDDCKLLCEKYIRKEVNKDNVIVWLVGISDIITNSKSFLCKYIRNNLSEIDKELLLLLSPEDAKMVLLA